MLKIPFWVDIIYIVEKTNGIISERLHEQRREEKVIFPEFLAQPPVLKDRLTGEKQTFTNMH